MGLFEWLSIVFGASTVLLLVLLKDATGEHNRELPPEKTNWRDRVRK